MGYYEIADSKFVLLTLDSCPPIRTLENQQEVSHVLIHHFCRLHKEYAMLYGASNLTTLLETWSTGCGAETQEKRPPRMTRFSQPDRAPCHTTVVRM